MQSIANEIWQQYEKGIEYQNSIKLRTNLPMFVKFYEGDQWPAATRNTKNLPRPVINIIKMICRNKKAAIISAPVRIVYKCHDTNVDTAVFNGFAEYIQKDLNQRFYDKRGISDGVKKGSYFFHYYWDNEAIDSNGNKKGALRCELIEPLNIFFENPCELDEQKQKWIIISTRMNVEAVRAMVKDEATRAMINGSSDSENPYNNKEQDEEKLITVLTKYFRKDGEVYCQKCTKDVLLGEAFSINPRVNEKKLYMDNEGEVDTDDPNVASPDKKAESGVHPKALYYPIVVGNYEIRDRCIYGQGEVEELIPNQKAINFFVAMSLLNAQEIAWGKYIALPGALKGQTITNAPGQVLTDYTGTGNGIKKMTEQSMQNTPVNLATLLIDLSRSMSGATEIATGEIKGGLSGEAIALLQSQAAKPIDDLRDSFLLVKEKQGKILAQFLKLYYLNQTFIMADESNEEKDVEKTFNSSEFENASLDITVEATVGSRSSVAGDIQLLNNALAKGVISFESYIKMYPGDAIGNKNEMLKHLKAQKEDAMLLLAQRLEAAEKQLQEDAKIMKEQKGIVDKVLSVIGENNSLKSTIAEMYSEADAQIKAAQASEKESRADAQAFAEEIFKMRQNAGVDA